MVLLVFIDEIHDRILLVLIALLIGDLVKEQGYFVEGAILEQGSLYHLTQIHHCYNNMGLLLVLRNLQP